MSCLILYFFKQVSGILFYSTLDTIDKGLEVAKGFL